MASNPFPVPSPQLGFMLDRMASVLFPGNLPLDEVVAWCHSAGVFSALATSALPLKGIVSSTDLTEAGAESLLGVLCSMGLVHHASGVYALTEPSRAYLLRDSPYFVGDQLCVRNPQTPGWLLRSGTPDPAFDGAFGSEWLLRNQHARNLPICVAAVKTGEFAGVTTMVDIAGGSGTFSIPLACEYPTMRVILTDLPQSVPNTRAFVAGQGVEDRVEVRGLDAFQTPWDLPPCDGMFIGNFFHGFDDDRCVGVLREAYARLPAGKKVWIHEMLWNADRNGPLVTAMYHVFMRRRGGKQRTAAELSAMLTSAGFVDTYTRPTLSTFSLVAGTKPR